MTENRSDRAHQLAEAAAELFTRGLDLGEDTLHYLESTLGCADPQELPAILEDASHPEHRTLLELIYFPDLSCRTELEPVLHKHSFTSRDAARAAGIALALSPLTRFTAVGGETVETATSQIGAELFFSRLHPERRPDPEIAAELEASLDFGKAMRCRVHLRACRSPLSDPGQRLVLETVREFANDPDLEDGLLYMLYLAQQIPEGTEVVSALLARRHRLESALRRAMQQESELRRHAVETLMTRGTSLLAIDSGEVRKEMDWLDRILIQVYQVMPSPATGPETVLDQDVDREGAQRIFDLFSGTTY